MADYGFPFDNAAAQAKFPRSRVDLTSVTQCPACFGTLADGVCTTCGLDLDHPDAALLAAQSATIADLLDKRTVIIARIRLGTDETNARLAALAATQAEAELAFAAYEKNLADAAAAAAAAASAERPPVNLADLPIPTAPMPLPTFPLPHTSPPPGAEGHATGPQPTVPSGRGSSIQVLLLIAGVSLVSLAAVLFIIYAFVNFGIEWRSAIIAAITVATFTIASVLRRRDYRATAEGIGAFAVVLIYLDAYAVRANHLFGSAEVDPQVYWGFTLLGSALGFILWHRLSALRVASVAGFAAVAPGAAILLYGLASHLDQPSRLFLSFAAMGVAGLLHPLARRRGRVEAAASASMLERSTVLGLAAVGVVTSLVIAFFVDSTFWSGSVALASLTGISAAHAFLALSPVSLTLRPVRAFGRGFAIVGAVAASAALAPTLLHNPDPAFAAIVPVIVAVAVALGLDTLWRRLPSSVGRGFAGAAAVSALIVASAGFAAPLSLAIRLSLVTLAKATFSGSWSRAAMDPLSTPDVPSSSSALAVVTVAGLAIGFSAISRTLRTRHLPLTALGGYAALLAVPLLNVTAAVTGGAFVLAALGLVFLLLGARRWQIGKSLREIVAGAACVALAFGYLMSWASIDTWLAGSLVTIALVLAARLALPSGAVARLIILGSAVALAVIAAIGLAQQLTIGERTGADYANSVRFVNILAVGILALASLPRAVGFTPTDRRAIFWISLPIILVTSIIGWVTGDVNGLLLQEYPTRLVVASVLLVGLLLLVLLRGNGYLGGERMAASVALAPTAFLVVDAVARLIDVPAFADISSVTSALLVAAGALAVSILRPSGIPRWAREIGIAVVVVPAIYIAARWPHDQTWLVLLLGAATVLLTSISADGLFGSASGRKNFGWLALVLGISGLWWRLSSGSVSDIEAYVLPLAGALLLIALLVGRSQRAGAKPESPAAPFIAFGGMLVAVIPIAVAAGTGSITRAIVIGAVSAVLLVAASFVRITISVQPYLDAAAATGAFGVITLALTRITLSVPLDDGQVDLWLGAVVVVLFVAAAGQSLSRALHRPSPLIAQLLGGIAITIALVVQFAALLVGGQSFGDLASTRVLCWAIAFALIAIISVTVDRGPLRVLVAWIAIGAVGILVFTSTVVEALTPFEATGLLVTIAFASSAAALVVTLLGASNVPRVEREVGLALLGLVALVMLPADHSNSGWILFEVAAVAALLIAISSGGLFGVASSRKHAGWLALALAVTGMWWRLSSAEVRDVEPYVLPLAGALLLIALLAWRAGRAAARPSPAPAIIALGGLLVAILPIGLTAAAGPIERPVIVGLASVLLLVGGSFVVGPVELRPYLNAAATAGAVGVLVVAIGRSWFITTAPGGADVSLDAWLTSCLTALLAAAYGQSRRQEGDFAGLQSGGAQGLVILGLVVVLGFETAALDDSPLGFIRAISTVLLFCLIHLVCILLAASPFSSLVGWVVFGFAAIASVVGYATSAFGQIEYATVPLAVALITGGALRLRAWDGARSWPHLGPGLLLLLTPSLLAAIEDRPIWRIAAIAIVAIAMTVIGLAVRLQAVFLVGAVATIVHTLTTFMPQLRELYELNSWLVWIVIGTTGGTMLIVLAARFEKSITSARSTLRRVGELR